MNRVITAIERHRQFLAEKNLPQEKLDSTHKALDMSFDEYVKFQELKSLAFASQKITLDEANTIYGYLGNSPETFNKQELSVKVVLTKIFAELLRGMIGERI